MRVKITVPATSANIGPGFDSLGLALSMYNTVEMAESDRFIIDSADGAIIPKNKNNLVYKTAKRLYDICGRELDGLEIIQTSPIPFARGLGSSSACIVAGLLGANALLGSPLTKAELICIAAHIEGHPDNVAPAMLGGFVASVMDEEQVYTVKVPLAGKVSFAALIPQTQLKTEVARGALPMEISHKDAVYNLSRASLLTAALLSGNLDHIHAAVGDKLHQPYRMCFIKNSADVFSIAYKAGACGVYISGAGSTIMAILRPDDTSFVPVARELLNRKNLIDWQVVSLNSDENGATVEKIGD